MRKWLSLVLSLLLIFQLALPISAEQAEPLPSEEIEATTADLSEEISPSTEPTEATEAETETTEEVISTEETSSPTESLPEESTEEVPEDTPETAPSEYEEVSFDASEYVAQGDLSETVHWTVDSNGTLAISGTGDIPDQDYSPWNRYTVTKLVISSGITGIGKKAFWNMYGIQGPLELPDTLEWIGNQAFHNCWGLTGNLIIPDSVTVIYDHAFDDCKNMDGALHLPAKLTQLGDYAFADCSALTGDLTLPDSLVTIGASAFEDCGNLDGTLTLPKNLKTIGDNSFKGCRKLQGDLHLPAGLESLGKSAFWRCSSLTGTLEIPDTMTELPAGAFGYCSGLTGELKIPAGTTSLGADVFNGCSGFSGKLCLPDSLVTIGVNAFSSCSGFTGTLDIPASVQAIGSYAFTGCSGFTGTLRIPDTVNTIGEGVFIKCTGFTGTLHIPAKWGKIPLHMFSWCSGFTGLDIPAGITEIDNGAFYECTGIGPNLVIPEGVERISLEALEHLCNVTSLYLPASLKTIENYAFSSWFGLKDVYFGGSKAQWDQISIGEGNLFLLDATFHFGSSRYTIRYEGVGDGENPNPSESSSDQSLTLKSPSRTGYQFAGWFTDEALTQEIKVIPADIAEPITLYAKWIPISYKISFDGNGGTGSLPPTHIVNYDEEIIVSECSLTRSGYHFMTWNTAKNGTGTNYYPGSTMRNLSARENASVILYAQWAPNTYSLRFLGNSETSGSMDIIEAAYGQEITLPSCGYQKDGYTFTGWNTLQNGKGKSYKVSTKVKNLASEGEILLYAQWTANKYTVIFHSNAAKDTTKKQALTYDGKETALTANSFSWKGHTFQGWTAEDGRTFANKEKVRNLTTEKTIDLYASWKVNEYTVVFLPNVAEGKKVTQAMTYDVPVELETNRFERTGYTFQGWATTAKGKAVHTDGKTVKNLTDKDGVTIRLYAVWAPTTYSVNFVPGEGATGTMKPMKMTYGKTYTLTKVGFKRAGYTFAGWEDEQSWETYTNKAKVKDLSADGSTVTLVAQWTPTEYTISYQGLTAFEKKDLLKTYTVETVLDPGIPQRPGCQFDGWYLDAKYKKAFSGFDGRTGTIKLYPKWETTMPYKYTVVYASGAEGATGNMDKARQSGLVCGKEYTPKACSFKRTGYQFAGWLLPDGITTIGAKQKFSDLCAYDGQVVTLTAQWKPISYKVRFNANKGSGKMADETGFLYDVPKKLSRNSFTRKGYTFAGWNTRSDGKGAAFTDAASVMNLTSSNNGTVTLYAVWKK